MTRTPICAILLTLLVRRQPSNERRFLKTSLEYVGGLIAFLTLVWYARNIWFKKVPAQTPASFLMWTMLDMVLLATTLANHKPGWLPGAWTAGATLVTIALFVRGKWAWSWKETLSAICATVAMSVWYKSNNEIGLYAAIIAMNSAGVPNLIDMWKNPIRESWPVWFLTVVACLFTIAGSDWTFNGMILPICSTIYNGTVTLIVLFKKPTV